jgi:hypothetical protein
MLNSLVSELLTTAHDSLATKRQLDQTENELRGIATDVAARDRLIATKNALDRVHTEHVHTQQVH